MKLAAREAQSFFRKPDPARAGVLVFGADPMRVADRRQQLIAALIGPAGDAEMRLTRISAADLRKEAALLAEAMKAQGFFPGQRAVLVEDATDGLTRVLAEALADWRPGDAMLVVTAGALQGKSSLKAMFEAHPNALAAAIYDDPPSRSEIEAALQAAGLRQIDAEALAALEALARSLDPGDFRQTVERIGLYKFSDPAPLTPAEVEMLAPQSIETDLDEVIAVLAEARADAIGPLLRRLYAQGVGPVAVCIGATRHFRTLHAVASDPGGPAAGIGRLRPPLFGPRRDTALRQAGKWGAARLEKALTTLTDTDLQLRSADKAPPHAVLERALIRLAMAGPRA